MKILKSVLTQYHGRALWAFCFLYYAVIILLSAIGTIPKNAYDTYEMLRRILVLTMVICKGLEYYVLSTYASRHYPDEWREYNGLGVIKPMTRFSYLFMNEIEPDKVLLGIKRNNRAAILVLGFVTLLGGAFLMAAQYVAGSLS